MKHARIVRLPRAFCISLALVSMSTFAQSADPMPVDCGDVLMAQGKYVLTNDLVCNPPAITIMGSGVHLNMQGHSITNALFPIGLDQFGSSGILALGTGGHVLNGGLHGFFIGLLVIGDNNKITDVTATDNLIGIFLCCDAEGNRVVGNTANNNVSAPELEVIGVGIQDWDGGRNNVIVGNTANGNEAFGILISDSTLPPVKGGTIKGNTANYNGEAGIGLFDGANGNVVRGNEFVGNANWGIISGGFADFPVDNLIQGNTALDSGIGDIADFDPNCANTWKSNTFATEEGADPSCTD